MRYLEHPIDIRKFEEQAGFTYKKRVWCGIGEIGGHSRLREDGEIYYYYDNNYQQIEFGISNEHIGVVFILERK
jgi:hypothetical protein